MKISCFCGLIIFAIFRVETSAVAPSLQATLTANNSVTVHVFVLSPNYILAVDSNCTKAAEHESHRSEENKYMVFV